MRVYEVAKQLGLSSKELLEHLKRAGREVSSHMSILSDEAVKASERLAKKAAGKKPREDKDGGLSKAVSSEERLVSAPSDKSPQPISNKREGAAVSGLEERKPNVTTASLRGPVGARTPAFRGEKSRQEAASTSGLRSGMITEITVMEGMPVFEVAKLMGKTSGALILSLLKKGVLYNRNNVLSVDMIRALAADFGINVISSVETGTKVWGAGEAPKMFHKSKVAAVSRWPIAIVMGHVDHGKTTFLDYVRKMNVAEGEQGGITQHISAYEVEGKHGKVVFLDTPGHEAFTYLRQRGAAITDLIVLVVAADDGIMPQTVEAIKHAKKVDVPIIVAINKIDKASPAAIEKVKGQLAQHDLMSEDWGGSTVVVPISAKTGAGIDELLEMIVLQAQLMELTALHDEPAVAFVLESSLEKGLGPVATVICREGTIRRGDFFVCGSGTGKVRLLIDSHGKKIKEAGPTVPVKIVGLSDSVETGDWLKVVGQEAYSRARAGRDDARRGLLVQSPECFAGPLLGLDEGKNQINVVLKTDTRGSREAILDSLEKLKKEKKDSGCLVTVISFGVGNISEGDVEFADSTGSILLGFHVKAEKKALSLAKEKGVAVRLYGIIYRLIEELGEDVEKARIKKILWKKTGEAVVRRVFDIKGVGVIAGCYLRDGLCAKGNKVICLRGGKEEGEGKVTSLQREKKIVKEVHAGYEFGFSSSNFKDWQVDDDVHIFEEKKG
jgi:translation initiation factor IF-2